MLLSSPSSISPITSALGAIKTLYPYRGFRLRNLYIMTHLSDVTAPDRSRSAIRPLAVHVHLDQCLELLIIPGVLLNPLSIDKKGRCSSHHASLALSPVPEHPLPDLIRLQVTSELIDIQTKLLGIGEEDLLGRSVRPLRLTVKNHVVHRLLLTLFSRRLHRDRKSVV